MNINERIKEASTYANNGHYLVRLMGICNSLELNHYAEIVAHNYNFVSTNFKPSWIDQLVREVSEVIVFSLLNNSKKPTKKQWASIVWGLDYNVLKENDLLKYRTLGGS